MELNTIPTGLHNTLPAHMLPVAAPLNKPTIKKAWVDYDLFCRCAKHLSPYNKRQIKSRRRWEFSRGGEINLLSVPNTDRAKYGFPQDNSTVLAFIEQLKAQDAAEKQKKFDNRIDESLLNQFHDQMFIVQGNFPEYRNKLQTTYTTMPPERLTEFAKRWAVWAWIIPNYKRFGSKLEIFHSAYSILFPDHFAGANGKTSFKNFYNNCEANGIENAIIDKRAVVKVQNRRSTTQVHFLQTLYIQNRKVIVAEAHRKLVTFCNALEPKEKPMSDGNVKIIFREFKNNPELFLARYGEAAAQKQLPYSSLLPAQHRNTQWQIDGWTCPFWGYNEDTQKGFQRYVLYLIRDNHSRKILGYSISVSENTTLILNGLDDAMRNTGVFPGELVSDKHSFHKTEVAARLRLETEKMGAIWTVTVNAQRNQLAERYNQYLDAICKEFDGYLGKNITATGKDARPAPEVFNEYAKPKNFKSLEEIKALAGYIVTEFNRSPLKPLEGLSPNEKYEASTDAKAFVVNEADRVRLVRPVTTYKVQRGQITIKIGIRKHEFQLPAALIDQYNNQLLEVTYEDLTEGIYITDLKSGEMLGCIPPKQKIHGAIPDQTEKDKKMLLQAEGRKKGTQTKARKTAQQTIKEGLQNNPDAIELINHYSIAKDIRQLAQQDNDVRKHLKVQGINNDKLPIRKTELATIATAPTQKGQQKARPFAPKNPAPMRLITPDEVYKN